MTKRILDLFCGVGGAAMGYHKAGFEVVGVDRRNMKRYPFEFHQGDAIEYLKAHAHEFDAFHASPPCQGYTVLNYKGKKDHPRLVPETRAALGLTGKPWIIENVPGAPLRSDVVLCGEMFGLKVQRHRWFEVNWYCPQPDHLPHRGDVSRYRNGVWTPGYYAAVYGNGGGKGSVEQWKAAMGIDWTNTRAELAQAIPPAYTEYLGLQLQEYLRPRKYIIPRLSRPPKNFRPNV